jgi:hypothetical protein
MTTQKATLEQFHEFVNAQATKNPERPIDNSGGWTSCAVGDFVREHLAECPEDLNLNYVAESVFGYDTSLFYLMNRGDADFFTYQELSQVLEEYGVENNELT